jgi:hypothetical protein
MKTKIICSLFLLFFLMGCKNEPQYSRFENHNVPACGIADPLDNLPWLKAYCTEHSKSYSTTISIYKNTTSHVNHIVIGTSTKDEPNRSPSTIHTTSIYSCEGERVLFQGSEGATPEGWSAFLAENTLVAKIWEVKEIE